MIMAKNNLERKRPIVALIYDFDGTLAPGNFQHIKSLDNFNALEITNINETKDKIGFNH